MTCTTLRSKNAEEHFRSLKNQYEDKFKTLDPEKRQLFVTLLKQVSDARTTPIPEYEIHEFFDTFLKNPLLSSFLPPQELPLIGRVRMFFKSIFDSNSQDDESSIIQGGQGRE